MVIEDVARAVLTPSQRSAARRVVLRVRATRKADLDALAQIYGTDKSSRVNNYVQVYRKHLHARRTTIRTVLEIGVGGVTSWEGYDTPAGGQSLKMWRDYFPNAKVVGIDLHAKGISGPRLHFEQGDQADSEFLRTVIAKHGPFDVIIDDGSHIGRHIVASYKVLWDAVKPGGFYVIEDLDQAYNPDFEGGPPGTAGTAVGLLKGMVDDTLFRYGDPFVPSISALHLYDKICFVERRS